MPSLGPWRDLARKAAQAIKRQLAQTESGLSRLLNPAGQPQSIPIPIPIARRQGRRLPTSKRFFTDFPNASIRSRAPRPANAAPSSFIKTPFGRTTLRPRLVGTTRAHGFRSFSTSPVNHAHVIREVQASIAQGIRAGVLNTPFYPPPSTNSKRGSSSHVMATVLTSDSNNICTRFAIDLVPPPLLMPRRGELTTSTVAEVDEAVLSFPAHMSKLRRDLSILSRAATRLDYEIVENRMVLQFPGKTREQVEAWLKDIGVSRGTVYEQRGFVQAHREAEQVDWTRVFKGRVNDSLETYVDAIDAHRCGYGIMA